jgi:long-chain acyl-CoA synthetase
MLYVRWCQIVKASPDRLALCEPPSGRVWTFQELATAAESEPAGPLPVVFPIGASAEFVLAVLRAWRAGQVVCPLEPGQAPPRISTDLPAGIAHLKTTSASTGAPRLVAFTPAQLAADAENIVLTMGLRPEWPNLGVISLAHSYGFSNLVLPLLLQGIPLILVGAALPEALRLAAGLFEAVTLPAVPALWQTWHEAGTIPPNVRRAISAGAPLPLPLEQAVFARSGVKIHNFYGSTECGGIAYDAAPVPRDEGACVGAPLHNVQVDVGQDGCIAVRSAAVGQTYWPEPDTKLGDGRFQTSDLGEVTTGLVFLRGRASDQINVAGRKVLPETIERVLAAHPAVSACVVFGVRNPDSQRGETIVTCVARKAGITEESLRQFAMTQLAPWQVPREWWFVDALEADNRGKLSRAQWRQRYLERAGPKP